MSNPSVLDFDALEPPKAHIKIDGNEVEVKPPTTGQMLKLASYGKTMQTFDKLEPEEADKLLTELSDQIKVIIPQLKDRELGLRQIMGIVEFLGEMVTPPDAKELKRLKISPTGKNDPKAPPDTSGS